MKPLAFALFLAGIAALTPMMTASASSDVNSTPYLVKLCDTARIVPFDVHYERRNDGLVITGRIKKRWSYRGRMVGHVDIRLLNSSSEMISEAKASIYGRSPTAKNPYKARFAVILDSIPSELSTIQVMHHAGG